MNTDEALLHFLDAMGRNDPISPYPDEIEPLPYPPIGATKPSSTGIYAGARDVWEDMRTIELFDGFTIRAFCFWNATSITVRWSAAHPGPRTSARIGFGLLDDPSSERWYLLGVPSRDEQTWEIDNTILPFSPEEHEWWYLIIIEQD